jgi:hypothetical protein
MKIIVLVGAGLVLVLIRGMRPSRWAIASLVLFAGLAVPAARADTIFVLSLSAPTPPAPTK